MNTESREKVIVGTTEKEKNLGGGRVDLRLQVPFSQPRLVQQLGDGDALRRAARSSARGDFRLAQRHFARETGDLLLRFAQLLLPRLLLLTALHSSLFMLTLLTLHTALLSNASEQIKLSELVDSNSSRNGTDLERKSTQFVGDFSLSLSNFFLLLLQFHFLHILNFQDLR